jgi:hypothetical protein
MTNGSETKPAGRILAASARYLLFRCPEEVAPLAVIAGLDPAIPIMWHGCTSVSGMAGSSPAMTIRWGTRSSAQERNARRPQSGEVEAIRVHHLGPRRREVVDELLLRVVLGIGLGKGPKLRVRAE